MDRVRRITPSELVPGQLTPGMSREEAVATGEVWAGLVHTEPRAMSGWHHHGAHDTVAYVTTGAVRIEFGPGGARAVEAGPGEFLHVGPFVVHREGNPSDDGATVVVVRAGTGPVVVNVEGPDPAAAAGPSGG